VSAPVAAAGEGGAKGNLGRSIGAVAAGFFATAALSSGADLVMHATGVFPEATVRMTDALFALAAGYRALATVAGGWLTARLAPARPMKHALILAAIGTVTAAAGGAAAMKYGGPEMGPVWYPVSLVLEAFPCIALGAWLLQRQRAAQ
jgi:hypothetical protein